MYKFQAQSDGLPHLASAVTKTNVTGRSDKTRQATIRSTIGVHGPTIIEKKILSTVFLLNATFYY